MKPGLWANEETGEQELVLEGDKRFRFLLVNLAYCEVHGTNNKNEAAQFMEDEDYLVIDNEQNESWLDGKSEAIKEYDPEPRE